jgi:hypothetical protein
VDRARNLLQKPEVARFFAASHVRTDNAPELALSRACRPT